MGAALPQGLRTLVLGSRVLPEAEWAAWNAEYQAAASRWDTAGVARFITDCFDVLDVPV